MCKGTNFFMDNSSTANRRPFTSLACPRSKEPLSLGRPSCTWSIHLTGEPLCKSSWGCSDSKGCFFGDSLDSGHPALRRFAASSAVRAAPAAQCTSKESYPCGGAARKLDSESYPPTAAGRAEALLLPGEWKPCVESRRLGRKPSGSCGIVGNSANATT